MKKIVWNLPVKTMEYLDSLTAAIAENPFILLMTAVITPDGVVDKVNITFVEEADDEVVLSTGAEIGVHAMDFGDMLDEREEAARVEAQTRAMAREAFMQSIFGVLSEAFMSPMMEEKREAYSVIHLGQNAGDAIEGNLISHIEVQE